MATIRRATRDDAGDISAVLRTAFAEYRHLYTAGGYAATTPTESAVVDRLAEGPVWVALDETGVTVGTASVRSGPDGVYLRGMAVDPTARGQGVGRALLETAEAHARAADAGRVWLHTTPFLDDAIALYRAAGFVDVTDGASDVAGTPLIAMEKSM